MVHDGRVYIRGVWYVALQNVGGDVKRVNINIGDTKIKGWNSKWGAK